jgi:hypothetical protein
MDRLFNSAQGVRLVTAVLLCLLLLLVVLASAMLAALRGVARRLDARAAEAAPVAVPRQAIREAVAEALAAERERELAEARAFWAEQEARAAEDDITLLPAPRGYGEDGDLDPDFADALRTALEGLITENGPSAAPSGHPVAHPAPGAEPAIPDARRHPSHPDFVPAKTPSREWTEERLRELAEAGTPLAEVRPGPMGTLDVYVFEDETTLCLAPGDPKTALELREALSCGIEVRLLGSDQLAGAQTLTFEVGDEIAYVVADRVVASL